MTSGLPARLLLALVLIEGRGVTIALSARARRIVFTMLPTLVWRTWAILAVGTLTPTLTLALGGAYGISIVYDDTPTIHLVAAHGGDDLCGLVLIDLEEREARHEVDLTDLHTTRDALVDELNELVGVHLVELTEVDEETLHPFLGYGIALIPLLLALGGELALVIRLLDSFLAVVVVEHTAKLHEHDPSQELLLVEPVELAQEVRQHTLQRGILGDLYSLDTIGQTEELLLTDLLPCR